MQQALGFPWLDGSLAPANSMNPQNGSPPQKRNHTAFPLWRLFHACLIMSLKTTGWYLSLHAPPNRPLGLSTKLPILRPRQISSGPPLPWNAAPRPDSQKPNNRRSPLTRTRGLAGVRTLDMSSKRGSCLAKSPLNQKLICAIALHRGAFGQPQSARVRTISHFAPGPQVSHHPSAAKGIGPFDVKRRSSCHRSDWTHSG